MKKFLFSVFILSAFCLVGCVKVPQPQAPNLNQVSQLKPIINQANLNQVQPNTNVAVLNSLVLDKSTKKPVAGAIVYIGANGSWQCQTNDLGQCTISEKEFVFGDYGVGVYKKGYQRSFVRTKFVPGPNSLTLEIELAAMPESITVTGTVKEIVSAAGSMSENHYFKIKTEKGDEYYLFNNIGNNTGFESYIDKKVTIAGYKSKGFIGWQYQETEGIYVEEIK